MSESSTLIATVLQGGAMTAQDVATISAMVVALVQVTKRSWPGNIDTYAPLIAVVYSALGVTLWVVSAPSGFPPARTDLWAIGSGFVSVLGAATGFYELSKMATSTRTDQTTRADQLEQRYPNALDREAGRG